MSYLFHENLYRSSPAMKKLTKIPVTICGAGALGANIAESLARSGVSQLTVIDCDRLDERNLSTQPYYHDDVGAKPGDTGVLIDQNQTKGQAGVKKSHCKQGEACR